MDVMHALLAVYVVALLVLTLSAVATAYGLPAEDDF
jgi:hypothetical protein